MFCGFYSLVASIHQDFIAAAWAIVAAGIFDMLDGRIARLAKATSLFGVEYDSLSDLISFGIAPAILLYQWALEPFGRLGWLAAFLFLVCGALRLARFNINTAVLPKNYFQGLPITMAAQVIATFIIFTETLALDHLRHHFVVVLTFVLATLMVSTVRFSSFKELNWRSRASFGYLLIGVGVMVIIAAKPEIALFSFLIVYIGISLVLNLIRVLTGRPETKHIGSTLPHEHHS